MDDPSADLTRTAEELASKISLLGLQTFVYCVVASIVAIEV